MMYRERRQGAPFVEGAGRARGQKFSADGRMPNDCEKGQAVELDQVGERRRWRPNISNKRQEGPSVRC